MVLKSKSLTVVLSLLFGSSGAQRFYLGQNKNGLIFLIISWILFPAIVWSFKYFQILEYWQYAGLIWLVYLFIIHIGECIKFSRMKIERFAEQDKSKGNTIALSVVSVLAAAILGYGANYSIRYEKKIDINTAKAQIVISSKELSAAFNADEEAFAAQYEKKVLQVEGIVIATGEDFIDGKYIALESSPGSPADVNCYFLPNHQNEIEQIKPGDKVTVLGVCEGRFLKNSKVIKVEKGIAPAMQQDTMQKN